VLFSFGLNLFALAPSEVRIYQNIARAQNTAPTSNQDALQRSAIAYDDNMQKGYEATESREYEEALSYFKIALSHRPEDFYATQAISNVERLLERQNTSTNNGLPLNNAFTIILILLFLLVIAVAISSIIISLKVLKVNASNKQTQELRERKLEQLSLQNEQVILKQNNEKQSVEKTKTEEEIRPKSVGKLAERIKPEIEKKEDNTEKLISQLHTATGNDRTKIIWRLATDADSRAIEPLLDIMFHGNSQEKTLILEAISQIASKSLKPINQALIMSLQDEQGQVRKNALRDVTKLYELITEIQPVILQAACDDPDPEVREIAIFSLSKLGIKTNALPDNQKSFDQDISATLITDDDQG